MQAEGLELDPGLRDFWVSAHHEPLEAIIKSEHHMGAQIWAWADDAFLVPGKGIEYGRRNLPTTHIVDDVYKMPGRGIIGDPMWGIVEGWRRVRPEHWLCKKLFSPVVIKEEPLTPSQSITIQVENRNFFIDLNHYICRWRIGSESGELRANVPPQTKGALIINPAKVPGANDTLVLEFIDPHGDLVDGYRLRFSPINAPRFAFTNKPVRVVQERPQTLDFASVVQMSGEGCELAFDRTSGSLVRGVAGGNQVLLGGPELHIMKSFAPMEIYPGGWHFTGADFGDSGVPASLNWNGSYGSEYTGGYVIKMDGSGNVEISYSFTYSGPDIQAREIGISLDLPLDFDRLEWDRKAEWSYYPDDHIGRPHGVAVAHPDVPQTVPPGNRPFALDDHPWGSNDFRSAKRNIYRASLTNKEGTGIKVISDSSQHVRATVGTHSISLKVLDYYGGSATGTGEWDGTYGNGRVIKAGDVLKGVVRLEMMR